MASRLAQQLTRLNAQRGFDGHNKATLLHDAKAAGHFTAEDAFRVGLEGFEQLCELDKRFERFRATLFGAVPPEREKQSRDEIERTNTALEDFLKLLTDYFTEPCGMKALEHLVRNFRVHVYNVDACLSCGLVYHATAEFQKLLAILNLKNSKWQWMSDLQKAQLPFPRDLLVQRCLNDTGMLHFVCEMAKWSSEEKFCNGRIPSFYAVLICETLEKTEQVSEDMMRCLMSVIAAGLRATASPDFRTATHVVIVQLCTRASLSEKALSALLQSLLEWKSGKESAELMVIACHMFNTQPHFNHLSEKHLKLLYSMPNCSKVLGDLMQQGLNAKRLLSVLLKKLVKRVAADPGSPAVELLEGLIVYAPLGPHLLETVVSLLSAATTEGMESIQRLIRAVDVHHPVVLDQAVNTYLKNEKQQENKQRVLTLLHGTPNGSIHETVPGSDFTLLAAADAPDTETRKAALEQLRGITDLHERPEMAAIVGEVLLRRLRDEEFEVTAAALQCDLRVIHDASALYSALIQLLRASMARLSTEDPLAEQAAIKSLKCLLERADTQFASWSEDLSFQLISYLFPSSLHQIPIALQIGKGMGSLSHRLAACLSAKLHELPSETSTVEAFNVMLVSQLAELLDSDTVSVLELFQKGSQRICCFLCAALEESVQHQGTGFDKTAALQCLMEQLRKSEQSTDYCRALLSALTELIQSMDPVESAGGLDRGTVHDLLSLVLMQSEKDDSTCAKALLDAFGGENKISTLLHFLTVPEHDSLPWVISKGLTFCKHTLLEAIEEADVVSCVSSLSVLLSHSVASVRRAALKVVHKGISHFATKGSPLMSAIGSLFEYLKENQSGIKADPDGCLKALIDYLEPSNKEGHRSKKQKTLKEHAANSGHSEQLRNHFLTELRRLDPANNTRELKLLFSCLKPTADDADLLVACLPILEHLAGQRPPNREAEELGASVIGMFHAGVPSKLFEGEDGLTALECFSKCLQPASASSLKKAALELMSAKWMKTVQSLSEMDLLGSLLRCVHMDPCTEISDLAAARAAKWPLKPTQVEAALKLSSTHKEHCLWMLELLQSREGLMDRTELNIFSLTQELLYLIWDQHKEEEIQDEITSPICRAGFGVLEKFSQQNRDALNMEMVVGYLQWSPDPVLRESIMALLKSAAASTPHAAMDQILKVLCGMEDSASTLQQQQAMDAVTAMVKSCCTTREQIQEVWKVVLPIVGTLSAQQRRSVLQATLTGMSEAAPEALSLALLHLLSQPDEDSLELSHQICQFASLSDRYSALALLIRETRQTIPTALETLLLERGLNLTLTVLKGSVLGSGVPLGSSLTTSSSLGSSIGLDTLLMEAIRLLQSLDQHGESHSVKKPALKSTKRQLKSVLSSLNSSMDPNSYLRTLIHMFTDSEAELKVTLLEMFRRKLQDLMQVEEKEWPLSPDICEICPSLLALLQSSAEDEMLIQLSLVVVQQLVHIFGMQQSEMFLEWIPVVAEATQHIHPDIRGSALTCMAAFLRELKDANLQYLPTFMPTVLDAMELTTAGICFDCLDCTLSYRQMKSREGLCVGSDGMEVARSDGLDFISGLALIEALLEGMGPFISPYLPRLLKIIFQPNVPEEALVKPVLDNILTLLPKQVPGRLLMPELLSCYNWLSKDPSVAALCPFLAVVKGLISSFNSSMTDQYLPQISQFLFTLLDLRQLEGLSVAEQLSVEDAVLDAFQCTVMKLNEKQFKPLLDALLDWMFAEPSISARHVTGFHLLCELTGKLKALFVGYVPAFLDTALELFSADVGKKPWSDAHANQTHQHLYLRRVFILQALYRALIHDEEDVLHQQSMERILAMSIPLLKKVYQPSEQFLEGMSLIGDPDLRFKGSEICQKDPLSTSLVTLLIQLGKQSSLQKSVNHKILKCCVKGSSYSRALSLCAVREIVSHSKEEFTPLIPETLPRIAELLESSESSLYSIAREILSLFEEITGESLEQCVQQTQP